MLALGLYLRILLTAPRTACSPFILRPPIRKSCICNPSAMGEHADALADACNALISQYGLDGVFIMSQSLSFSLYALSVIIYDVTVNDGV